MFSRLIKRRPAAGDAASSKGSDDMPEIDDDALFIDEVNPERLLGPGHKPEEKDMSWLDEAPVGDRPEAAPAAKPAPAAAAPVARGLARTPRRAPEPEPQPEPAPVKRPAPNAEAAARAPFPHGWLVVVEGAGTGSWFVLERGLSQIGTAEGQAVRLGSGDDGIAAEGHAELYYDEPRHAFVLYRGEDRAVRLNGIPVTQPSILRDGDVIALGGTALRLVALCSQNFSWTAEMRG
ncbi:FHA domain-containing protein [Ovoidimarina sediminis]|uniref:FHA domain-containing protein n=1 Tax=Ovoidimarina sediminis TaxID=3079856 RepID=UPI00290AFDCC|nr:FHA domain-containing protein [Rhodophyticola sp. MJ-SS7]MDU8943520.1 FHA domain-containing protein [Rhodophyticola sp. MJ-SS7]